MWQQEIRKRFGARVRQIRERKRWSQDVLTELSGLNRSYIGSVERAEHKIGMNNVVQIASALEVPISTLFEESVAKEGKRPKPIPESRPTPPAKMMLNKRTFFELLKQCANDRPDLVVVYLERCGAVFVEP